MWHESPRPLMGRFRVEDTGLAGLKCIERMRSGDERGFFSRIFCAEELSAAGWQWPVSQINHSYTAKCGTVRGMHFQQEPHAEAKLVYCLRGEVFDVAIDVRAGSPTFLKWHAERLSLENGRALLIPKGFAHGFQALTDNVELLYLHSAPYQPASESGLSPADAMLGIVWPLPLSGLSARDAAWPALIDGMGASR